MLRPVHAPGRPPEPRFPGGFVPGSVVPPSLRSLQMFDLRFMDKFLGRGGRLNGAPARRPIRSRLALESLEGRLTPAAVSTSLVGGNLTLTDSGASNFTISQPAANQIKITPAAGTTINGSANAVTIQGVTGNLNVNLGSGNDTLTFDLSAAGISVGNLSITGSTGNKTVQTKTDGRANFLNVHGNYKEILGDGMESTRLNQFNVDGNMTINHANGGTFVFLGVDPANLGTRFNHVGGDLSVNNVTQSGRAATGFDVNALEETNVGGSVSVNMGNASGVGGWTTFGSLSNRSVTVGDDVTIKALTGFLSFGDVANDGMEVHDAQVAGHVTMDLGSGVGNTALFGGATAASTSASSLTITGRGAHDGATVGAAQVQGDLSVLLTGRGANSISLDGVAVGGDTSLMAAGGGNSIAIDDQAPGSTFRGQTDVVMTGRNNFLSINSKHRVPQTGTTTFQGDVTARLGNGRSTLNLADIGRVVFQADATSDGGAGRNTAVVSPGNITGDPTIVNFD